MEKGFEFNLCIENTMIGSMLYVGSIQAISPNVTVEWKEGSPGLLPVGQRVSCVCRANADIDKLVFSGKIGREIAALASKYTITYTDHTLFDMQSSEIGIKFAMCLEGKTFTTHQAFYTLKVFN